MNFLFRLLDSFKKKTTPETISADLISFRKETTDNIDRITIFRYAKFVMQTFALYKKISHLAGHAAVENPVPLEKILHLPLAKDSFDNNKLMYKEIYKMWGKGFPESGKEQKKYYVEQLYFLNCIYALRFFEAIKLLGVNGHEKSAFLYLAQRNYREKILLNFKIKKNPNYVLKEFDAIIIATDKKVLVEDKTRLERDTLQQVFGYNSREFKVSHKDILCNKTLTELNNLPEITEIEIIYSQLDRHIPQSFPKFAKALVQKPGTYSQAFRLEELMELLGHDDGKARRGFQELLRNSCVRTVVFTHLDANANKFGEKVLHPEIARLIDDLYARKSR